MKRIIIVITLFSVLSACSISSYETSVEKSALIVDPDILLTDATRYFNESNLEELNIVLNKLISEIPNAMEQIETVQKMSDELTVIKEKEEAEKELQRAAEIKSKSETMIIKEDEVTGVTWYKDKSSSEYINENNFLLQIGKQGDYAPYLRLRIQYAGDNWLFIEKYIIKTDDETFTIYTEYGDVKLDNNLDGVWEWIDIPVTNKNYNILEAIVASEKSIIRHQGDQYHFDRTVTNNEVTAIKNVLALYEALGGKDLSE